MGKKKTFEEWYKEGETLLESSFFKNLDSIRRRINAGMAADRFKKALKINKQSSNAWHKYAIASVNDYKFKEAVEGFEKALELNPNIILAWKMIGLAYQGVYQHEKAIEYFDKFLKQNPSNIDVLVSKGNSLKSLVKFFDAIDYYKQALELNSELKWLNLSIGELYGALGHFHKALIYLEEYIKNEQKDQKAWQRIKSAKKYIGGHPFLLVKSDLEDIPKMEARVNENPENFEYQMALGLAYDLSGKYELALIHYEKAQKLNPDSWLLLNYLGIKYQFFKNYDKTIECYEKVSKILLNYPYFGSRLKLMKEHSELFITEPIETIPIEESTSIKYCNLCGSKIEGPDQKICQNCGTEIL